MVSYCIFVFWIVGLLSVDCVEAVFGSLCKQWLVVFSTEMMGRGSSSQRDSPASVATSMLVNIHSVSLPASNAHSFALLLENNCIIKNILSKCGLDEHIQPTSRVSTSSVAYILYSTCGWNVRYSGGLEPLCTNTIRRIRSRKCGVQLSIEHEERPFLGLWNIRVAHCACKHSH